MSYAVKEIFYTLQGEGANTGRPAVFCRFAGCNLWTGREQDRATAVCRFCDTDFVGTDGTGGGKFTTAAELAAAIAGALAGATPTAAPGRWSSAPAASRCSRSIADADRRAARRSGFEVAVETNGTLQPPAGTRLGVRQPQGRVGDGAAARGRAEARLPAGRAPGRSGSPTPTSLTSSCSRWTGRRSSETPSWRSPTAWSTRSGG